MRFFFITFMMFVLFSSFKTPPYVIESNRISSTFIKDVCSTNEYACTGQGGNFMHGIEGFTFFFRHTTAANIEEARKLLIDLSNRFLKKINSDAKIRPYLSYPFILEQLSILISFPSNSYLSRAVVKNGKLHYAIENDRNITETIHTETWEEALNALKQEPACI